MISKRKVAKNYITKRKEMNGNVREAIQSSNTFSVSDLRPIKLSYHSGSKSKNNRAIFRYAFMYR